MARKPGVKKAKGVKAPKVVGPDPEAKAPGALCSTCPAKRGRLLQPLGPMPGKLVKLAVVGEAPCGSDLQAGEVFQSAGARLLQRGLDTIGVRRGEVHWTNAVLCQCSFKAMGKAAKACAPRLAAELAAVGAPVVVPLGSIPTQSVIGGKKKTPIGKWRGSVSVREGGGFALPLMHPAEVRKAPKWGPVLEVDVERIGRVLADGFTPPESVPGRRTIFACSLEELRVWLPHLEREVSFDVETVGLGPTQTALVCFGLSDRHVTVVVPWADASNGINGYWTQPGEVVRLVNACLRARVMVTHNGPSFDHIVAERYGFEWAAWEDTLLMQHASAGHMPKNLAHVVTSSGVDVGPWKQLESRSASFEELLKYNGKDCLYTILAYHELRARVSA